VLQTWTFATWLRVYTSSESMLMATPQLRSWW
jgi:hypothetical protein